MTAIMTTVSGSLPPVQVYLRIRPLLKEEEDAGLSKIPIQVSSTKTKLRLNTSSSSSTTTTAIRPNQNSTFANAPPLRRRQQAQWKEFTGFTHILTEDDTNKSVYERIRPIVQDLVATSATATSTDVDDDTNVTATTQKRTSNTKVRRQNISFKSACIFTYGHTGSGKTHTLLGYPSKNNNNNDDDNDDESSTNATDYGIYRYAADELISSVTGHHSVRGGSDDTHHQKNEENVDNSNQLGIWLQVTELYKQTVVDLLTEAREECTIRQDSDGVFHVRPPMIEDDQGRKTQPLLGQFCHSTEEVVQCVDKAIQHRRVGTSTHHDKSSRSHLIIQLELVTPQVVSQRRILNEHVSQLSRLGWLQYERSFGKHKDQPLPAWCDEYNDPKQPSKLRHAIKQAEQLVYESTDQLHRLESVNGIGNTLVFCDLAGNEYAQDSGSSTKDEFEEASEINKSLLAVKSMLRNLRTRKQQHRNKENGSDTKHSTSGEFLSSYRDSKLTMMLRRYLDNCAIMLAHVSPADSARKSVNTLTYASLLGGTTEKENKR